MTKKERTIIELTTAHRGQGSSMFTGRPQGEAVRKALKIDEKDKSNNLFTIHIPIGTTSFNASFFLGLFYPSVKKLKGYDNFLEKYELNILEINDLIKKGLIGDIEDCERQARNEYSKKTGLSNFF